MTERNQARRGLFGRRTPSEMLRALDRGPWAGPGRVSITPDHLVLGDGFHRERRTSLRTVGGVSRADALVWVRRTGAHDWLIRCRNAAEAARLEDLLEGRRIASPSRDGAPGPFAVTWQALDPAAAETETLGRGDGGGLVGAALFGLTEAARVRGRRGLVRISRDKVRVMFLNHPTERTSRKQIRGVVRRRRLVWVQRWRSRYPDDWLVVCASEADAQQLADALRPGP